MDSAPEEVFDRLTRLATRLLGTPIAMMTLLDDERQFAKSRAGDGDGELLPASQSFCRHVVERDAAVTVSDVREDPRIDERSTAALAGADLITYAGVPLTDADGHTLGSLCTMDGAPREWSSDDVELLRELASSAMTEVELRMAHSDLVAREEELRAIVDGIHEGLVGCASDGTVLQWNPAAERILGWTGAQVIGRSLFELLVPGARRERARRLLASGAKVDGLQIETYARHRDGRTVHVELSLSLIDLPEGRRINLLARDVGELRAQQLRHAHLAQVVETATEAIATVDVEGRVTAWNHGCERLYGWTADEVLGRPLPAVEIAGPGPNEGMTLAARAFAGETVSATAARRRRKDGSIAYVDITVSPLRGDDDAVVGVTAIGRDVTDEHRLRLELQSSERRFRHTFDQAPIGVTLIAPDRTLMSANRTFCEMVGYSEDELVGGSLGHITQVDDRDNEVDAARAVLGGASQTYEIEKRYRHRDGHIILVALTASLVRDEHGEPSYFIVHTQDVTAERAALAARREVEDRLRVTVEHAPIGVALVDLCDGPQGRLLSLNGAFARLLGEPDPATAQLSLTSILHPDDVDLLHADLARLRSNDLAGIEREVRCLRPDGIVWLLLTGSAVPAADGAPHLAVVHALDIGERKRFEGQLQEQADHDVLTGLFNRRRFEQELTRAVALVERYHVPIALLMVDLDGFKNVNDTMGHSYGDEIITRVGAALRVTLRETDVIGRLGGDEFAIIVNSVGRAEAEIVAEKVLGTIRDNGVVVSEHRHARVTASVGIAMLDGDGELDAEALLAQADLAMYTAKQTGKNRLAFAHEDGGGSPEIVTQRSWLTRLRSALEQDRFELFAQPIRGICAPDDARYELLLRMRGEDDELITPDTFLYNAERSELIQEIDRWVLGQALALLARHQTAGIDLTLSINMSTRTLSDPRLLEDLRAILADHPSPRDRLIVEVTETAAIVNIDRAREIARGLRTMGARFALDDFGAGFASFYYLKHLEFDYVKIDGEFVKSLTSTATDQLVVRSVVDLARGLGAQTIAEFVGDDATVRLLRKLGVDYGQGFHLGRPAPIAEILPVSADGGCARAAAPPRDRSRADAGGGRTLSRPSAPSRR